MLAFLWTAFAGGMGIALLAGPLGCFVVWRRMAYFGDTLAHSALLGVVLGLVLQLNITLSMMVSCALITVCLVALQNKRGLATDTVLGILAHTALSLGLVIISLIKGLRVDLMAYLFGDLLSVGTGDVVWIWGIGAVIAGLLVRFWRPLLLMSINEDLAQVEGVPVTKMRLMLMLAVALTIAIIMKIVGILLVVSLLIIPAASARNVARSPEQMAVLASVLGMVAVVGGLLLSIYQDTPSGPSIVLCCSVLFVVTLVMSRITRFRQQI